MTVSYNWLKEYLNIDLDVVSVGEILTDTGLEVEGIKEIESIKGGLKGVVIGEVKTCVAHPNADKLKITTVDVGAGEDLQIVCGAPNVAVGQKVPVATVGTVIYAGDDSFTIKKGKIRGEVSLGMICAEDELGLGKGHDGIMVLSANAEVGSAASTYFKVESDFAIEIGLTPNRTDALGHYGVARDLRAGLAQQGIVADLSLPEVDFRVTDNSRIIGIEVQNTASCPQYYGLTISNVKVGESPDWLKNRLIAIGLKPVNNVVDVTNFVLHELGHPLHAFDADKIVGGKILVKNFNAGTKFTTLDDVERELHPDDLMIADENGGLCIAGVFGGKESGVSENTQTVFLEGAWFNPVSVRKTAKRFGLNTDASFRYERGVDPNMTLFALKRAASLIVEIAEGKVSSDIQKSVSQTFDRQEVSLSLDFLDTLIGNKIPEDKTADILALLEIEVLSKSDRLWQLAIPTYRVDVTRQADVVEEVLRIYGFNNVDLPEGMKISVTSQDGAKPSIVRKSIAALLTAQGYSEIMNNSLTKESYYQKFNDADTDSLVRILNPLSQDLGVMRQNLIYGGLEVVSHNINRQTNNIKVFEFGNTYFKNGEQKYSESEELMVLLTGKSSSESWIEKQKDVTFFEAKGIATAILSKLGISGYQERGIEKEGFAEGLSFSRGPKSLVEIGQISGELIRHFEIDQPVFALVFDWSGMVKASSKVKTKFHEIPRFPSVRRDLALLVNDDVQYENMRVAAQKAGGKLIKEINLFDVYQGKNLPAGKKSYALSFILQDEAQTLIDKKTEAVMGNVLKVLQKQFDAELR